MLFQDDFRNFIYPEVVQDKLLSIKTPDTFNDTQVVPASFTAG